MASSEANAFLILRHLAIAIHEIPRNAHLNQLLSNENNKCAHADHLYLLFCEMNVLLVFYFAYLMN